MATTARSTREAVNHQLKLIRQASPETGQTHQHGHDGAEHWHASRPAPSHRLLELATDPGSSSSWSSSSSPPLPTVGLAPAPRPPPRRWTGRCRPRRSRFAAGAGPPPRHRSGVRGARQGLMRVIQAGWRCMRQHGPGRRHPRARASRIPARQGRGSPCPDDALGSGRPQTHPHKPAESAVEQG